MAERITVIPEGGQPVLLTPAEHLATGGEGAVYLKNDTVYKVYLDPSKAIAAGMERKVAALAAIRHAGIASPTGLLRDKHGAFLGLTLPRAKGEALCKLFTNTWRDANQFGLLETGKVVDAMRDITDAAHAGGALMVDANEMNWLVAGTQPTAIDVDSWQLPGFPATAIMPSIRDYATKGFSEGTDWFAWAVVTFQLWTGIHPYKGTHPDFARGALEERMRSRASVFDSRVRLPGAARPLTDIPPRLRDWYERTFATGERTAPPASSATAVTHQTAPKLRVRQTLSGALRMERLGHAGEKVLAAFNGFVIVRSQGQLVLWDTTARAAVPGASQEELAAVLKREAAVLRTASARVVVQLVAASSLLAVRSLDSGDLATLPSRASRLWQSGNRVFALVEGVANGLHELDVAELGTRLVLTVSRQWAASVLSTQFLRGVFVQDCMGAPFVGVLDGAGLLQGPAAELRDYRIAEGFAIDRHNVWLTGIRIRDGETVRVALAYKADRFVVEEVLVVSAIDIDAAATSAGVGVLREGDDLIVAKGPARKRLEKAGLSDAARLFSLGAGIGSFEDGEIVRVSLS
jgi:hypothetical protein